jgi:RNA polymerase sigma-70 factor (ECF subfamily)
MAGDAVREPSPAKAGTDPAKRSVDQREKAADLYRRFGPAVYRRCLKLLRDREAAKDATQEVFVKLVRDIAKFDDPETALPWMYRVATNHCLNHLRAGRRHGEQELGEWEVADPAVAGAESYPDRHLAGSVLARFDEGTQAVAVGVLVDGMGHEELAGALGISRKTVERRLARFLERAREMVGGAS